jgi:hypothetical protein
VPSREDSAGTALAAATAELYAVAPDEFVATRTRLVQDARAGGDASLAKEVGRLRRPTVAAWAVNRTVRERPVEVERLRDVGHRLRAAQAQLDAARLRDLRSAREELLAGFVAGAAEVAEAAGRPLAPAALEEVRSTVIAALASEQAAEAVVSGHLTRALSYSGFGEVDLSEAVARTSSGAVLTVVARPEEGAGPGVGGAKEKKVPAQQAEDRAQEEQRAQQGPRAQEERRAQEQRLREVEEAHATAATAAEEAALAVDQARDRADEARWRVEELEAELQRARKEHHSAEQAATAAARARRTADAALGVATRRLERARAETAAGE